jgi:hypothetical protein
VVRLPHLLAALLCGFAAALAVGCGDRSNLIPASRASELTQQLSDLQASIGAGECDGLSGRVRAFHDDAASLGRAVDKRLRSRINDGAAALQAHAVSTCQAKAAEARQKTETQTTATVTTETQPTTVPTTTTPTTTTPTVPTTPTTTTPTVPTETTPAPPAATDPGTTPPADNGGVSAGDGGATP